MVAKEADVVVIGGGLIGTSVAFRLARKGKHVVLLERDTLASGASGASFGWVTVHFASYMPEYPDYHMRLMAAGLTAFAELAAELGEEIDWHQTGGLSLVYSEEEQERQSELCRRLNGAGVAARIISRAEVEELEPALGGPFIGALWSPGEALVNPLLMVRTFAREARRHGAEILTGTPALGVEVRDGAVVGVATPEGLVRAPAVVNAAGLDGPAVASLVELDLPIGPSRGQQLVVQGKENLISAAVYGQGLVRRIGASTYIVGGLREEEHAKVVTPAGIAALARMAVEMVPALRGSTVTRAFVGLRPIPGDGKPIWGPVPGVRGYFLANLHFGVTLAPLTGHVVTSYVLGEEPELDVGEYRIDRFLAGPS